MQNKSNCNIKSNLIFVFRIFLVTLLILNKLNMNKQVDDKQLICKLEKIHFPYPFYLYQTHRFVFLNYIVLNLFNSY